MQILGYLTPNGKKAATAYVLAVLCLIFSSVLIHFLWPTFDTQVMNFVRQDRGKIFSALMAFISWWGMSFVMVFSVVVVALLFRAASYKREAWFFLSVLAADAVNVVLKLIIDRPRPEAMDIFPKFQQSSFPSGHVVHYVVFFGLILTFLLVQTRIHRVLRWGGGSLCVFLIVGVSIARVYLGTHWPTDILVAYIIGSSMLAVVILLYLKGLKPSP